jgi:hypothetical protein
VDEALSRRVALPAGAFQRDVKQPKDLAVLFPELQRQQRQERRVRRSAGREAGRERRLRLLHGRGGRAPLKEPLLGGVDPGNGLEAGVTRRLLAKALQVRGEPGTQARDGHPDHQQLGAQLERALGVERAKLVGKRSQCVDGGFCRATARRDRAAPERGRRIGSNRRLGARDQGRPPGSL